MWHTFELCKAIFNAPNWPWPLLRASHISNCSNITQDSADRFKQPYNQAIYEWLQVNNQLGAGAGLLRCDATHTQIHTRHQVAIAGHVNNNQKARRILNFDLSHNVNDNDNESPTDRNPNTTTHAAINLFKGFLFMTKQMPARGLTVQYCLAATVRPTGHVPEVFINKSIERKWADAAHCLCLPLPARLACKRIYDIFTILKLIYVHLHSSFIHAFG